MMIYHVIIQVKTVNQIATKVELANKRGKINRGIAKDEFS